MMAWLVAAQEWIYGTINGYLSAFASNEDWSALLSVMPLGIGFGAIHALTPGHSKTLLASYLVGSPLASLRGLAVSSVLAATHVGVAVVIALFAAELLTRTLVGAGRAPAVEDLSRGLLVLIGIWFVVRAVRGSAGRTHGEREGVAVGVIAGLIPCPLTLFVMVLALSRGVPEAGLAFALAMMIGVGLTLGVVALLAVAGRSVLTAAMERFGTSISVVSRTLDALAGSLLIVFGLRELLL
ncbi:sulfite exporter TauE/SafE family protein [Bauldia litoralis]|uniref:urease accessory protein UreH domain-containing protein n=1 Tax=Bauldia litoralis TaxID=665467 RepID=UPI003264DD58